ncbi:Ig-like domain-containing protein [Pleurocapsa sp. PCC 7319]|uniref:Ig-like domain-containing protein n=1 Tax=Pleurocapsa sp. PCC 7319 TaxID=118161 RepID=UPI0003460FF3|nr:DUF4347 domain-containing protein [Pleurocapsa sp. PCC 7319]
MEVSVNQQFLSSQTNLAFVDRNILGYEDLVSGIAPDTEILILESERDAIAQITETLNHYEEVSSLHIVSHGDRGSLQLGNTNLSLENLGEYQDELLSWGNVLTEDSDILLYGCNVAEGEGKEFVDVFSQMTGSDIAASTDLTGSRLFGGDGDLEYATGNIEAELALETNVIESLDFVLVNDYVVQTEPNFQKELVLSGLREPTSMAFLPDNRMLFLQKNGVINIFDPQDSQSTPEVYLDLSSDIQGGFEAGLLDIAIDPNFGTPGNDYIYVYYSHKPEFFGDDPEYRISRFTHNGNQADINSEFIVFEKPDGVAGHHDGGGLDFGPDGKLYLTVGDQRPFNVPPSEFDFSVVADLSTSNGKLYRVNPDGTAPTDNPFVDNDPTTDSNQDFVWAYGLRNSFRSRWDIPSDRYFIGDVGGNVQSTAFEEINLGQAGVNYGWPDSEGFSSNPNATDPIFAYAHTGSTPNGGSITGGVVYRGNQFPENYQGAFFFGDYTLNWIRYIQFDVAGNVIDADPSTPTVVDAFNFDNDASSIVSLEQGPDGALYYLTFGDFAGSTGTLNRVSYNVDNQLPVITQATADTNIGSVGSTINFTATATDGDNDPLSYTWKFGNGDTANGANISYNYNSIGVYTASLEVSDGTGTVMSEPIIIQIGGVPDSTIVTPNETDLFRAGETITFSATATDPDETLTSSNFVWSAELIHNDHTHPDFGPITGSSYNFTVPTTGHGFSDAVGYKVTLTVTDSDGLFDREVISIFPEKVDLSFASNIDGDILGGVDFTLDGLNRDGPFVLDTAIDHQHQIIADEVIIANGIEYTFNGWSNGVTTPEFSFIAPETDTTYTANYVITNTNVSANAKDDLFVVGEDEVAVALDVLANDTNSSSILPTITTVGAPSNGGTVTIDSANNGLIYTPALDFAGIETFTYSISDGNGGISEGNVRVAIQGINDAPNAVADSFNVAVDSTDNALDILANDLDPDIVNDSPVAIEFSTYEVTEVSIINPSRAVKVKHSIPTGKLSNADLIFDATAAAGNDPHFHMMGMPADMRPNYLTQHNSGGNGDRINFTMAREDRQAFAFEGFSYTSGLFFPGTNAGFTVIATLANGGEISQTFAAAETETAFQAVILDGAGWQNVTSVRFEGSVIGTGTEVSQELNIDNIIVSAASDVLNVTSVSTPNNGGSVSIDNTNGQLIYTPQADFEGTETFGYTISDLAGATSTATVAVNVGTSSSTLPITDGLVLHLEADNGVTTDGSDLVTGWTDQSGLGNNLTGGGDPRLVSNGLNGQPIIAFDGAGDKLENLLGLNGLPAGGEDRTIFFLAKYNSNGYGGFTYGNNATNQAFGLVVDNKGDLSIQAWGFGQDNSSKVDGTGTGWLVQGAKLEGGVLTHYKDGAEIDSSTHNYNTSLAKLVVGAEIDSSPYLDMEVGGIIVYDRALSDAERQQVETYLENKYFTGTPPVNQAPTVENDTAVVTEGAAVQINVLNNDSDTDGTIDATTVTIANQPSNGTVTVDGNTGIITYTHNGTTTTSDSFTYTVADNDGAVSTTATVDLTINPVTTNQAPTVANDNAAVTEGGVVQINVLNNDSDADGTIDVTTVTIANQPSNGTVTVDGNTGIITYTHNGTTTTSDSFTYNVADDDGAVSTTATVDLTINPPSSSTLPITEGLVLHLEADSGVTTDGSDLVTGWTDQSGLGNNLTGGGDPRLVSNGLNGQPIIAFDGAGDKLENLLGLNGLPAGGEDRTIFFLAKYNSNGYGGFTYGNNATNQAFGLVVDNKGDLSIQAWGFGQDNSSKVDGTGTGWLVQGAKLEGGVLTHYKDGAEIDSSTHNYNTSLAKLVVGAEIDSSPYLDMEVGGIIVYDRALSDAERQQVNAYFQDKYGLI